MRLPTLAALLALSASGCAAREHPYRFSSPLLGAADVPPPTLPARADSPRALRKVIASRPTRGWQADAQAGAIRSVSARGLETTMPNASAEAASTITDEGFAREVVWMRLPAPHRDAAPAPAIREPSDLRALIGTRDKRDPTEIVIDWLTSMNLHVEGADGPALVAWAAANTKLGERDSVPSPADLLVFDHATSDDRFDLIALAIARDARGVIEFLYAGGGVIRRGFLDPARPSIRRDLDGLVVNTFLRHGKKWPPKGTRYLAGELLVHVIHVR